MFVVDGSTGNVIIGAKKPVGRLIRSELVCLSMESVFESLLATSSMTALLVFVHFNIIGLHQVGKRKKTLYLQTISYANVADTKEDTLHTRITITTYKDMKEHLWSAQRNLPIFLQWIFDYKTYKFCNLLSLLLVCRIQNKEIWSDSLTTLISIDNLSFRVNWILNLFSLFSISALENYQNW